MCSFSDDFQLVRYIDSDFAGSIDDRKSTSGYTFHLGIGIVAWASKKKPIVTIYLVETEYLAGTSATCQIVWMQRVLKDLMHEQVVITSPPSHYQRIIFFKRGQSTLILDIILFENWPIIEKSA